MIRIVVLVKALLLVSPVFAEPPPDVHISEFSAENHRLWCTQNGRDPDWIELHNAGDEVVDLAGWALSDREERRWIFPDLEEVKLEPGGFLLVFASNLDTVDFDPLELHTNFRLCEKGDSLFLYNPQDEIHDALTFPEQGRPDVSFIRVDFDQIEITLQPTPGQPNDGEPVGSNCQSPWKSEFSHKDPPCSP